MNLMHILQVTHEHVAVFCVTAGMFTLKRVLHFERAVLSAYRRRGIS